MSWSSRRRTIYGTITFIVIVLIIGIPAFFYFYEAPTCFDGVQNGDETGVDCGGSCAKFCPAEIRAPQILWTRTFKVTDGVYNAVAYVENQNVTAIAKNVFYTFKLFDEENLLIVERSGVTTLSLSGVNPIFEASLRTGERVPARAFLEFDTNPQWERIEREKVLEIENIVLTNENAQPRIEARIVNMGVDTLDQVEIVATVFDFSGNAIASSRTRADTLDGRSSRDIVFTWPEPFGVPTSQIDVIPRVLE